MALLALCVELVQGSIYSQYTLDGPEVTDTFGRTSTTKKLALGSGDNAVCGKSYHMLNGLYQSEGGERGTHWKRRLFDCGLCEARGVDEQGTSYAVHAWRDRQGEGQDTRELGCVGDGGLSRTPECADAALPGAEQCDAGDGCVAPGCVDVHSCRDDAAAVGRRRACAVEEGDDGPAPELEVRWDGDWRVPPGGHEDVTWW